MCWEIVGYSTSVVRLWYVCVMMKCPGKRLLLALLAAVSCLLFVFHFEALQGVFNERVVLTRVWPLSASTLRTSMSLTATDNYATSESVKTFEKRRKHYIDACAKTPVATYFRPSPFNRVQLLRARNLAYCNVAKTGSTLWKEIIYYVQTRQNGSFYDTHFKDIHNKMDTKKQTAGQLSGQHVQTVVFVREPYSRLFSAYVDKMFRPSVHNWNHFAAPVLHYNLNLTAEEAMKRRPCTSHVTFPQFIRYFIDAETGVAPSIRRNPHYIPVSQHCGFCTGRYDLDSLNHADFQRLHNSGNAGDRDCHRGDSNCPDAWRSGFIFDFIGKTEDISTDTHAVFKLLNLSHTLPSNFDIDVDARRNTIIHHVRKVFREDLPQSRMQECMTKDEALRRVWENFQIRGLLGKRERFPFSPTVAQNATMVHFTELALSAFGRSQKDPDLKSNKKLAMTEAYGMIKLKDRKLLREIFEKDFQLFDYPSTIPEVFPKNDVFTSGYFELLDMSDSGLKQLPM